MAVADRLQVWNDQVVLSVLGNGTLDFRQAGNEAIREAFDLCKGVVEVARMAPVTDLFYYGMPCIYESLSLRLEGIATPLVDRTAGRWPTEVDDDELQTYPHLHFLEERRTGTPWRFERWYTLAGPYLVFDSEQYFERACPAQHGKDWERWIVQLRQVANLADWGSKTTEPAVNLVRPEGS